MEDIFKFYDDYGPAKIIHFYQPTIPLKAVLVIDNVAAGPAIGGVRMAPDVSTEECFRLARAMTLKNAAAEIPHGGGKAVIYGDAKMPKEKKQETIRCFAQALRDLDEYIPGPDMGTDEECMAWIRDEIGRSVGLPREVGGIPLDEIGATGWGVYHCAELACEYTGINLDGARVVIQGFGAVGKHAARYLAQKGAVLIGASDSSASAYNKQGLDIDQLIRIKDQGGSVADVSDAILDTRDKVIDMECDIWIPAARPDVIDTTNVARLNTRLVIQGANIPMTHDAEIHLHERGIICIPDFIANAGGVICASVEYNGESEQLAFEIITEKIRRNTRQILDNIKTDNMLPRDAATQLAFRRINKAESFKRWAIF